MGSTGETYRAEAEAKLAEGQRVLEVVKSRPSLVFQKVSEILVTIPADQDEAGRKAFNFGVLRRDLEDLAASVQGGTDVSLILAMAAFAAAHTYNVGGGLADILEAQVGIEAIRENRKKRDERRAFTAALNLALASGDFKKHDQLVSEYRAQLERDAAGVIGGSDSILGDSDGSGTSTGS